MRRRTPLDGRDTSVKYASEAAMCELLRGKAREEGWVPYPETGGWDLILFRPGDELQVGVQAKLRPNLEVLAQTIRYGHRSRGPHVHAVLVPSCSRAFHEVAKKLDILVLLAPLLTGEHISARGRWTLEDAVERAPRHSHLPGPCWLPPFVPETLAAGVPGPRQVTEWKVSSAQFCAAVRRGEAVSYRAMKSLLLLEPSRFLPVPGSKPRIYVVPSGTKLPDLEFPEVAEGLKLPRPALLWEEVPAVIRSASA